MASENTSPDIKKIQKVLCDENIHSREDARKWILENHPDRRGDRSTPFDSGKFTLIRNSMTKKIFCDPKTQQTRRKSKNSSSSASSSKKGNRSNEDNPEITKRRKYIYSCIRKRANWSSILNKHRFESNQYNENAVFDDMVIAAPKIRQMLDTIDRLDEDDLKNHGKVFKHFIYSDVKEGGYGAKILASAFHADGYVDLIRGRKIPGRTKKQLYLKKSLNDVEEYQGFALLSSSVVFKTTYTQKLKKDVINVFNKRPDNIHGKNIRFIILDSGFKEGIDLFDVKYVHILEPSATVADLKQIVGRATRTCGQKGLHFQDGVGWELFVYNYYLTVPEALGDVYRIGAEFTNTKGENSGKLFKNKGKIIDVLDEFSEDDPAEKHLTHQLYTVAHPLSVDFDLTTAVHGDLKPDARYQLFDDARDQSSAVKALMGGAEKNKKYQLNFKNIKSINCSGRCGKRSTKEVPASQKFMEKVYKKYGYTESLGRVPEKNKRAYFCKVMRENAQFCDDLNYEWANQMAIVPFVKNPADVSELELVPFSSEDKMDYRIFEDEPMVDKKEQKNAIMAYKASTSTPIRDSDDEDVSFAPHKKMGYKAMRKHVQTYFSHFDYPEMKTVNKCVDKKDEKTGASKKVNNIVIDYSPSQNFVSHFFTPKSAYKGIMLWHSVGTGKTCSAIATSSATFEKKGYTILWVTRTTLKSDVYKNIFDMICHHRMADAVKNGEQIPDKLGARTRMISENWIKPMSYKQFSNLLKKNNSFYDELKERNGEEDILRKTLVIIDEAHKLYGGDLKASERPNMEIMEELIHNSYKKSGNSSVKMLIMTATPFTNSPMEFFKLLNLMVEDKKDYFPTNIKKFKREYMRDDGIISEQGMSKLANQMAGYVSYLDRSKDASQFAQPIMIDVPVMMSHIEDPILRNYIVTGTKPTNTAKDESKKRKELRQQIKTKKKELRDKTKDHKATMKRHKQECKERFPSRKEKADRDECLEQRKERELEIHEAIVDELTEEIERLEKEVGDSNISVEEEKELRKKLREVKKSLLQEIQMATKCKLI